jgi:predicted GNAT superfamily acetyltransferase
MPEPKPKPSVVIRDLRTFGDLKQVEAVEKEVWSSADLDVLPMTLTIASREAGNLWLGAFDGPRLVGFAFGIFGLEHGRLAIHSHMLAVLPSYRDSDIGYRLKLAQREWAQARRIGFAQLPDPHSLRIEEITWTFDPLQSKNAHLNFAKLGVVSDRYKPDFYGPETSSALHRNSTDRLWVRWPIATRRVEDRLRGKDPRPEMLDALAHLHPLVQFNGEGKPARADLTAAVQRQRIAIEIPSDIGALEQEDLALAQEWRQATRWAFTEGLSAGFIVAEFCRTVRGQQGPGVYLLQKGTVAEYVPGTTH